MLNNPRKAELELHNLRCYSSDKEDLTLEETMWQKPTVVCDPSALTLLLQSTANCKMKKKSINTQTQKRIYLNILQHNKGCL
jgi:hypothetical protein